MERLYEKLNGSRALGAIARRFNIEPCDLCHDVLLKLLANPDIVFQAESPEAMISRVAMNVARSQYRSVRRDDDRRIRHEMTAETSECTPQSIVERNELVRSLRAALGGLSDLQQEVLVECDLGRSTVAELSRRRECRLERLKSTRRSAFDRLRRLSGLANLL
jgi:RNA polymerase sigma factor (sigma-70 family)